MSTDPITLITSVIEPHVSLTTTERRAFAAVLHPGHWDAGGTLFERGHICRELVLFESGLVRAYNVDSQGREANHRFLAGPNLATALTSVITGEPAEERVEAVTPVIGFRASVAEVEALPRSDRLLRVLAEQHYLSMERRMRMLQLRFAAERYRFYREHLDPAVVAAMPDFHVASYLGVSPETLSRARRRS